ncbi:MAG: thioredoxin [Chitinispirillaceae bacterium]|nr:thioredoxin [Chitinispirillaceae bacterium]
MKNILIPVFTLFMLCTTLNSSGQPMKAPEDSSQLIADRIVQSELPVLVDFWAVWCGPCKMLNPIIEDLEKTYRKRVLFVKVNVDIHRALSAYFGVQSIPSVFVIKNKNVVAAMRGVQPKERYIEELDKALALPPPDPPEASQ